MNYTNKGIEMEYMESMMNNRLEASMSEYEQMADRIAQLETELFEARKDQERYRFVRNMTPEQFENTSTIHEDFDRQIDAMIKEQQ